MLSLKKCLNGFGISRFAGFAFALVIGCSASTSIGTGDGGLDNGTGGSGTGGSATGGSGTGGSGTGGNDMGRSTTGGNGTGGNETGGSGTGGVEIGRSTTGGSGTGGAPYNICNEPSSRGPGGKCGTLPSAGGNSGYGGGSPYFPNCANPTSLISPSNISELRTLLARTWYLCNDTQPLSCYPQAVTAISHADRFVEATTTEAAANEAIVLANMKGTVTYCQPSQIVLKTDSGEIVNTDVVIGSTTSDRLVLILNSGPFETRYLSY